MTKKLFPLVKDGEMTAVWLLLQIVSFRAHLVTIFTGKREKWGAEVKA